MLCFQTCWKFTHIMQTFPSGLFASSNGMNFDVCQQKLVNISMFHGEFLFPLICAKTVLHTRTWTWSVEIAATSEDIFDVSPGPLSKTRKTWESQGMFSKCCCIHFLPKISSRNGDICLILETIYVRHTPCGENQAFKQFICSSQSWKESPHRNPAKSHSHIIVAWTQGIMKLTSTVCCANCNDVSTEVDTVLPVWQPMLNINCDSGNIEFTESVFPPTFCF